MAGDRHRGAQAPGLANPRSDRRVNEIDEVLRTHDVFGQAATKLHQDPFRALQAQVGRWFHQNPLTYGVVTHSIPYVNWYRVQLADQGGIVGCRMAEASGFCPMGVRSGSPIPPYSLVLVFKPRGRHWGEIIGVLPPPIVDNSVVCPDWIVQGGQSGLKREPAHSFPISQLFRAGGVIDFSANRPLDSTCLEWTKIADSGIGILIDPEQAYLRVNEMCGLFLSLWDSHCRLAGVNLDVESAVHGDYGRDDEGESRVFRGVAMYPWEALGLYAPGTEFTATFSDDDVQYRKPRATVDLAEGLEDVQPFYRYQEYGGYLGQGALRMIALPPKTTGLREFKDTDLDEGLFCESIGADGAYLAQAAKSWGVVKRCKIVVPKLLHPPEDGKGDDARANNYKFSGQFGGGEEHKLSEVQIDGEILCMRRVAGADDLVSFAVNWKKLHPFHYHKGDFRTAQEAEQDTNFDRVQESLDFSSLSEQPYLDDPEPKKLKIDHRYSDAFYYERESFFLMHEDGSVHIGGGGGEEIVLAGGKIRLAAPGGVDIIAGTEVTVHGRQVIIKGEQSVDVSAATENVHIKAEKHLMMLAGNGGTGALMLESKGEGTIYEYENLIGEDVVSSGILLRTSNSTIGVLAQDIYMHTGGPLGTGNIVMDAAKGEGEIIAYGSTFHFYTQDGLNLYFPSSVGSYNVVAAYRFGQDECEIDAMLDLNGTLTIFGDGGSIWLDGDVEVTGSIQCGGSMADQDGGELGKVSKNYVNIVRRQTQAASIRLKQLIKQGTQDIQTDLVQPYYQPQKLGDDTLLEQLHFSFRDDDGEKQYHAGQMRWVESRWEQMVRLGLASGGDTWEENAVEYQGRQLYPWPGHKKWKEEPAFLQLEENTMFDAGAGYSKDRPGPYTTPKLADWKTVTMESGFKTIK